MRRILLSFFIILMCFSMAHAEENCFFVWNKKSKKYHVNNETCPAAKRMNDENKVCFVSPKEAEILGYIACKICKPNKQAREIIQDKPFSSNKIMLVGKEE